MMSVNVLEWWRCLCAVAAFNIVAWSLSALALGGRALAPEALSMRRKQVALAGIYVFGCAFRSVVLVYDVPRICLFDHWFSSVLVGRSVATVAELCFVGQLALLLNEVSHAAHSAAGRRLSFLMVPLIAVAEVCSWYSVLTTSNLGHVAEESIWGLMITLLIAAGMGAIYPRCAPGRRPWVLGLCMVGLGYVVFMFGVDVPMYWARWLADEAGGRQYMTLAQGFIDVATRRVVSHRWADWHSEVIWMTLYFSGAVWLSISLIHAPVARPFALDHAGRARTHAPWAVRTFGLAKRRV